MILTIWIPLRRKKTLSRVGSSESTEELESISRRIASLEKKIGRTGSGKLEEDVAELKTVLHSLLKSLQGPKQ
ncbi:MAG: hypothetical protein HY400_06090 [Elusimicrobia bacterium]|nr:hypothetical protein [Elusimicrobiota bacterium]